MRIVVAGGGVAGLAAALRLVERAPDAEIMVVEGAPSLGGKLRTRSIAATSGAGPATPGAAGASTGRLPVEGGAESFLFRDPTGDPSPAVLLARELGLGDALVHPAAVPAAVAVGGQLHAMPTGTLMGVPTDPLALHGLAEVDAARDRDAGRPLLGPTDDVAVGALVRNRLGDQVADRLVDPLLGGVYAGRADDLSLATTVPGLADACRTEHTLLAAARLAVSRRPVNRGPVFATVQGGVSRLIDAAADRLRASGVAIHTGQPVRELRRTGRGWLLTVGSTRDATTIEADAVVLALPARPAARLLSAVDADAAAEVGQLDYASMALITLALPGWTAPDLSGFLVPATEGYAVKAVTFFTRKWPHLGELAGPVTVLRASVGRYGDEHVLQRPDDALVGLVRSEVAALLGGGRDAPPLPAPLDATVTRWGGALPQYGPGHQGRITRVRGALPPTLALAGAGYDGVGIPACVRSGWAAADQLLANVPHLEGSAR